MGDAPLNQSTGALHSDDGQRCRKEGKRRQCAGPHENSVGFIVEWHNKSAVRKACEMGVCGRGGSAVGTPDSSVKEKRRKTPHRASQGRTGESAHLCISVSRRLVTQFLRLKELRLAQKRKSHRGCRLTWIIEALHYCIAPQKGANSLVIFFLFFFCKLEITPRGPMRGGLGKGTSRNNHVGVWSLAAIRWPGAGSEPKPRSVNLGDKKETGGDETQCQEEEEENRLCAEPRKCTLLHYADKRARE